jgi:tetratricopeptide (TPR) repeat protein
MVQPTQPDISPQELQFLEDVRKQLEEEGTLLAVQACAVPLTLEPDLARLIMASPVVKVNPHPDKYLAEIYSLPFVHRYPDGTFAYDESARQYFDGLWQNGGSNGHAKVYASLNSLIADYYRKQLDQINWDSYNPSHEVRRLTFREAFHRLAAQPEQGLRFLGNFIAQSASSAARADAYAADNICSYREPFISPDALEVRFIRAKYHYLSSNYKEAKPLLLAIYRICEGNPRWLNNGPKDQRQIWAIAAHFLGYIELQEGRVPQAIGILKISAQVERKLEHWAGVAMTLNTLGKAYLDDHQPKKAIAVLQESANLARQEKDVNQLAMTLNTLGKAYLDDHKPKEAIAVLKESIRIDPDLISRAMTLTTLGNTHIQADDPTAAVAALCDSLTLLGKSGHLGTQAMAHNLRAQAYVRLGEEKLAIKDYRASADINRKLGDVKYAFFMDQLADQLEAGNDFEMPRPTEEDDHD